MAELRLENVSKNFGKMRALSDINLIIEEGTFCVVLGPSGCGKSTLLNLIAGLEDASRGKIYLGGKDITNLLPQKRNIAMVFQSYALYPHLSVFENIAFGLRIKKEREQDIKAKVEKVSGILNIKDKLDKFPRELSGGERQRVATGRAIVREPALFLFDEPLSNLDARLRVELRGEFIKLHRRLKKTIIYVTHDQMEALALGQMVVVMKEGSIQQISAPQELYNNPGNLFAAEFIGAPAMNIIKFEVKKSDSAVKLSKKSFILEIPDNFQKALRDYIGKEVYFGFRPSAAKLSSNGGIKGEVVFTETLGEDIYSRIKIHPEIEVGVKITEPVKAQSSVVIALEFAKCYLFGSDGKRIYLEA